MTRAERNANPGNIRVGASWRGLKPAVEMTPEQAAEQEFCVFESPKWGFRAMGVIFQNYAKLYMVKTIKGAITRWAPPSENNTEAYIKHVCDCLGTTPDERFNFSNRQNLTGLLKAVSIHECGGWKFTMTDLSDGIDLAMSAD